MSSIDKDVERVAQNCDSSARMVRRGDQLVVKIDGETVVTLNDRYGYINEYERAAIERGIRNYRIEQRRREDERRRREDERRRREEEERRRREEEERRRKEEERRRLEAERKRAIAALEKAKGAFDYILIDCPPSLGLLTINALSAADSAIIPIQSEYYALEGLSQLMNTISLVRQHLNKSLKVEGVVLTMYDGRSLISKQIAAEIKKYFSKKLYEIVIPRNVRLSEAPSHGKPIVLHDPKCMGARAYAALTEEFLKKTEGKGE